MCSKQIVAIILANAVLLLLLPLAERVSALSVQSGSRQTTTGVETRREWFRTTTAAVATTLSTTVTSAQPALAQDKESTGEDGVTLFTAPSGLKYIELKVGDESSPTPRYGQLCSIQFTAYMKLPNSDKKKYDSAVYLIKHGNGRTIPGLDEGLHTMRPGGVRRLIIPPKLGYIEGDLGPIPENPFARAKLSSLLDEMVAVRGGNIIMDVELRSVISDEADQGYYEDGSLTPEQFDLLRNNLMKKASDAVAAKAAAGTA